MNFFMTLLKKIFGCFSFWSFFGLYAGSNPASRGVASPKTRHAVTVLFEPLERQNPSEFRGILGVASFKMCNHGASADNGFHKTMN